MKVIITLLLLLTTGSVIGQDLNARVQILAPQVPNSNTRVLEVLESSIRDFLNGRRWTNEALRPEERIDCNFVITITEWDGSSANFKAEAQIQSNRPVFNTNYASTILNITDKDFSFTYSEGQPLDYSDQNYISNLTSLLAFYAYTIIGMDFDTFSEMGGTPYFERAQTVLNNAQNSPNTGWKAFEDLRNRFWLIENILNVAYRPIRESMYTYHRLGLDLLADNPDRARKNIQSILPELQKIDRQKQGAVLNQVFFTAKSDELVNILSDSEPQEKNRAYTILSQADPANSLKYEALRQGR